MTDKEIIAMAKQAGARRKYFVDCEGGRRNYKGQSDDAAYIALANPENSLRLIELVRQMAEALEFFRATAICQADVDVTSEALAAYKELTK